MDISKIGKVINIGDIQKKVGSGGAEKLFSAETDKVSISTGGKELSNRDMVIRFTQALMSSIPDVRQDKMAIAKEHLAEGYYNGLTKDIADRLLGV